MFSNIYSFSLVSDPVLLTPKFFLFSVEELLCFPSEIEVGSPIASCAPKEILLERARPVARF